jgi:hypothetical protein
MKPIDERLHDAQLVEVPESLDRSMEQLLRWAEIENTERRHRGVPMWLAAVGCAAGLILGVLIGPLMHGELRPPRAPNTTIVIVEPSPELVEWIATADHRPQKSFFERQHGELDAVSLAPPAKQTNPNSL